MWIIYSLKCISIWEKKLVVLFLWPYICVCTILCIILTKLNNWIFNNAKCQSRRKENNPCEACAGPRGLIPLLNMEQNCLGYLGVLGSLDPRTLGDLRGSMVLQWGWYLAIHGHLGEGRGCCLYDIITESGGKMLLLIYRQDQRRKSLAINRVLHDGEMSCPSFVEGNENLGNLGSLLCAPWLGLH